MLELILRTIVVGAFATVAALLFERGLAHLRVGTRHAWTFALLATAVLPFIPQLMQTRVREVVTVFAAPALVIEATSQMESRFPINAVFTAWLLFSAVVLCAYLVAYVQLWRSRQRWTAAEVARQDVYMSDGFGPAVFGFLTPRIVVPQWVCEAPEAEQELIVLHEREHIRAHDQLQLLLAIVSTVLMPWNPFTWLQSRKLRFTVETDCDQRVLAAAPDHARYASLLVNVGTKQMGLLLTPALAEHRNGLERRLGMLGAKLIQNRWKAAGLMVTGVLMTVAACESRLPQDATEEVQATEQEVPITADRTALELEERELVATPANGEEPNPSAPKLRMRGMQPTPLRPDASLPRKVDPNGDPHFTPHTTRPEVANRAAVGSALKSHYPPLLRNAGIGGTSTVWLLIDEDGKVMRTRLAKTSGRNELDAAALRVAQSIEFTPAQHEGNPVRVWIQLPIVFKSE